MKKETQNNNPAPRNSGALQKSAIHIDYERYEKFLENADLTGQEKREFIDALWSIIMEFVSLGFGVHPLQQVDGLKSEKVRDDSDKDLPDLMAHMLSFSDTKQSTRTTGQVGSDAPRIGEREES